MYWQGSSSRMVRYLNNSWLHISYFDLVPCSLNNLRLNKWLKLKLINKQQTNQLICNNKISDALLPCRVICMARLARHTSSKFWPAQMHGTRREVLAAVVFRSILHKKSPHLRSQNKIKRMQVREVGVPNLRR